MLKLRIIAFMLLLPFGLFAQKGQDYVKLSYGFGDGGIRYFTPVMCDCSTNGNLKSGSISFTHFINQRLAITSGLEYNNLNYLNESFPTGVTQFSSGNTKLITVPAYLSIHFLKYFYIKGGFNYNKQLQSPTENSIASQNGLGIVAGLGVKLNLGKIFVLSVEPELKRFAIFSAGSYPKYLTSGINFGIGIKL